MSSVALCAFLIQQAQLPQALPRDSKQAGRFSLLNGIPEIPVGGDFFGGLSTTHSQIR
jgi:hypothetical protein